MDTGVRYTKQNDNPGVAAAGVVDPDRMDNLLRHHT